MAPITRHPASSAWPELRSALRSRGLSLADLARAGEVPYVTLTKYVCGYARPPEAIIRALADLLAVDPAKLRPRSARG